MALPIAAAISMIIWVYLVLGRGGFWRMHDAELTGGPVLPAPCVAIIVPARNEAAVIAQAVASLAAQQYPGRFHIVVVDDHSTDGTAESARVAGDEVLTIIPAAPLESGWTGKLWAVHQGIQQAARFSPDYLLLTDADIVHSPANLASLVAHATANGFDLVSLMVSLHCRSIAERALIPAFVFFFFLLYPPAWIRRSRFRTAGAAGGCLLVRREGLERIGGLSQIRGELIDDCALAREIKGSGGRVWLGLTSGTASIREYPTFNEIGRMISRTAFTQLGHSWWMLAGTAAGLALTFLVPPAAAVSGSAMGAAAWLLMSIAYIPALRFYGQSPLWAPLLPAVTLFYLGATIHSAMAYRRGAGGMWKERAQAVRK